MSQTELFKRLGAPLANPLWSWGAVRPSDGVVFLRVWQDRKLKFGERWYMMVTHHNKYVGREKNLGYKERLSHVSRIRSGAACYMVMCLAEDVHATPRKIKSFNKKEVFVGGRIIEESGDIWVEMVGRKPISEISVPKTQNE